MTDNVGVQRKHYITVEFDSASDAKNFAEWINSTLVTPSCRVSETRILDDRGIPTEVDDIDPRSAPYCPSTPCDLCTGDSDVHHPIEIRKLTSYEWCKSVDCCSATIDWAAIYDSH